MLEAEYLLSKRVAASSDNLLFWPYKTSSLYLFGIVISRLWVPLFLAGSGDDLMICPTATESPTYVRGVALLTSYISCILYPVLAHQ